MNTIQTPCPQPGRPDTFSAVVSDFLTLRVQSKVVAWVKSAIARKSGQPCTIITIDKVIQDTFGLEQGRVLRWMPNARAWTAVFFTR